VKRISPILSLLEGEWGAVIAIGFFSGKTSANPVAILILTGDFAGGDRDTAAPQTENCQRGKIET
jgi:hypothetical protein